MKRETILLAAMWLLMVPPFVPDTHEVNLSAPLAQWTVRRKFPRNQGCENAKFNLRKAGLEGQNYGEATGREKRADRALSCAVCSAQCVSEDDPRLNGK